MKTVAIIPARSGSKGLPKKNIKLIAGKPLIAWSIEHARMSKLIDEVYVSTDCSNIAEVSKNYGANVPFLRPDNISNDFSTTESVVDHFCDFLHNKQSNYENILLVQCTSPIRAKNRFDDAINNFSTRKLDSLVPVSQTHRFLWKNFDQPCPSYDFERRPRRQDLIGSEKQFVETGSFYLFKRTSFLKVKNRICGNYGLYLTPEEESFDIDSALDFLVCEALLKTRNAQTNFVEYA